jgi:predicted AAA+ superfamily ATPase
MERVINQQNPHWTGQKYAKLVRRKILDDLLKKMTTRHIQVLTGIRRCGKSSVFRLIINELLATNNPKSILFLNMDDPLFYTAWNHPAALYSIIETAEKMTGEKVQYLFLDEIQTVTGWEHFVKSAYDSEVFRKIFVTGSNSSLLQGEYSTLLSGRYFAGKVYPYSLKELFDSNGLTDYLTLAGNRSTALRLVDDCLEWGCFPEIQSMEDPENRSELLKNYFESIVLKDCVARHKISDVQTLKKMLLYLMSNIGAVFSYNSLSKAVESNENTVKKYLGILADCYILSDITNFSLSQKAVRRNTHKIYSVDTGITNAVSYRFFDNKGTLFENFVFNELQKQSLDEITFAHNPGECDFIVKKNYDYQAIQVCFELTHENSRREWGGFAAIEKEIPLSRKTIITYNQEQTMGDVEAVPAWKYFFGTEK